LRRFDQSEDCCIATHFAVSGIITDHELARDKVKPQEMAGGAVISVIMRKKLVIINTNSL